MNKKQLDIKHESNCAFIAYTVSQININSAIDWSKVRIKIDDSNVYKNKAVKK